MNRIITIAVSSLALAGLARGAEVYDFIKETMQNRSAQAQEEQLKEAVLEAALKFEVPNVEDIFKKADSPIDIRTFTYDKLGRLESVSYTKTPEKNETYKYDSRGNLVEKTIGNLTFKYSFDRANQLTKMESPDGVRDYVYDNAGRLVEEKVNGKTDVTYKYGYLDKVIEVDRQGKVTKFRYDGFGMLAEKIDSEGNSEKWVWDGIALVRRGKDIYVNEAHISGGVPIISRTSEGTRYHESDYLGTTLWSTDMKGNLCRDYSDTTVFGEGSIQRDRSARFTGKPYDEDLQAFVFPYRNYNPVAARWSSADPSGYPDGPNQHFYACIPTISIDIWGLKPQNIIFVAATTSSFLQNDFTQSYNNFVLSMGDSLSGVNVSMQIISTFADLPGIGNGTTNTEIYMAAHGPAPWSAGGDMTQTWTTEELKALNQFLKDIEGCDLNDPKQADDLFKKWKELILKSLET